MILCKCVDLISVPVLERKLLIWLRMFLKHYLHDHSLWRLQPPEQKTTNLAREQIYQRDHNKQNTHSRETENALGCYTGFRQKQTLEGRLPCSDQEQHGQKEQEQQKECCCDKTILLDHLS